MIGHALTTKCNKIAVSWMQVKKLGARRSGFTLIELLISLAILLTLVAVLLPAIAQSRAAAHRLTCFNNLKQIGIALHLRHDSYAAMPGHGGRHRLCTRSLNVKFRHHHT